MTYIRRGAIVAALPLLALMATAQAQAQGIVEVRDGWRGGGVGIYIGPGYGPDYGYYDGPRYRTYYYDDDDDEYYDRRYRKHSYRWTRDRFEHPLGRR